MMIEKRKDERERRSAMARSTVSFHSFIYGKIFHDIKYIFIKLLPLRFSNNFLNFSFLVYEYTII